jgi:hypothetical protein
MKLRVVRLLILGITVGLMSVPSLFSQALELNPYFGGVWPDSSAVGEIKNNAMYGVRAGVHLDPSFSLEANFGYLNHFEVMGTSPKARGFLYEVSPTYSFNSEDWPLPKSFTPLLAVGVGGITTHLAGGTGSFTYNTFQNSTSVDGVTQTSVQPVEVRSGDTFLTLSAGGGIKINPGPVGFRADIRGRMLPNYYRSSPVWLEATVGISFMVGRRH